MANCSQCGRKLPPLTFGRKICQWCVQHEAAQRGEIAEDARQPVIAAPWVRPHESTITLTHVLFGANIAVYLAMALASGAAMDFPGPEMVRFGANYGPLTLSGDWWRLVTYMFLHGGLLHIAFNMWCLWDLGALCESLYGRWTYLGIYLITGVAGGVASVGWNPGVLSVGASGAIFGLAGALIASFYLGEFSLPRVAISGTLRSLLIFAGFNLFFGGLFSGIDNACHIGGLVSGLILGTLVAVIAPQRDNPLHRFLVVAAVALLVAFAGLGVFRWRGGPLRMARDFAAISRSTPDRAVAQLQAILRKQPNLVEAHFALAREFFNVGRYPDAEAEFKRVIALRPGDSSARFDLGLTYLDERRLDDARATFTKILSGNADDSNAHYGLGLVLADQQQYQPAIDEFKSAVRLGPRASGIYYEMGQSYAKLGQYDDAIKSYLEGKDKDGDDPDLEDSLAAAYLAKGMTQQAQEARDQAVRLKNTQR
jgi:rhomboid protease GluP